MGQSPRYGRAMRRGFTLVEILVVIGIIAVLITLTAAATIRFIGTQYQKNTETTIDKVSKELSSQWDQVIRAAKDEPVCQTAQNMSAGDPYIARVIHIKMRLKQEFPMNYYEALHPTPTFDATLPPIREYVQKLTQANVVDVSTMTPPPMTPPSQEEMSACLAMALMRSRGGKGTELEVLLGPNILGATTTQVIQNPPNGPTISHPLNVSLPIILDAWGSPIVLYRWPTGNTEVDASGPPRPQVGRAPRQDPQDSEGKLQDSSWQGPSSQPTTAMQTFEATCHLVHNQNGAYAYYLVPVIASGGPNQKLGIALVNVYSPDPMQPDTTNDADDNIYNFRLRLGGKGD